MKLLCFEYFLHNPLRHCWLFEQRLSFLLLPCLHLLPLRVWRKPVCKQNYNSVIRIHNVLPASPAKAMAIVTAFSTKIRPLCLFQTHLMFEVGMVPWERESFCNTVCSYAPFNLLVTVAFCQLQIVIKKEYTVITVDDLTCKLHCGSCCLTCIWLQCQPCFFWHISCFWKL